MANQKELARYLPAAIPTHFVALALLKLARLNGVAPRTAFTRHERKRLESLSIPITRRYSKVVLLPALTRYFKGPDGWSWELTAAGWNVINAARDHAALAEEQEST